MKLFQIFVDLVLEHSSRDLDRESIGKDLHDPEFDFAALLSLALWHRSEGHLYCSLQRNQLLEYLPGKAQIHLNQKYEANLLRNQAFGREASIVSRALGSCGVRHAFFKGLSPYYDNGDDIGKKQLNDLDVLIDPSDFAKGLDVLFSLGYEYGDYSLIDQKIIAKDLEDITAHIKEPFRFHHLRYPFVKQEPRITGSCIRIEPHLSCGWRGLAEDLIDTSLALDTAVLTGPNEAQFISFAPSYQLQALILQLYHDFVSLWDIAVRKKDFEIYKVYEIMQYRANFPGILQDQRHHCKTLLKKAYSLSDKVLKLFSSREINYAGIAPNDLQCFGLPSDGIHGSSNLSIADRFLQPLGRASLLSESAIREESQRRSFFWENIFDLTGTNEVAELRNALLAYTLNYVFTNSPYYRELLLKAGDHAFDFLSIPYSNKTILKSRWKDFICDKSVERYHICLTGSTMGDPLTLLRSEEEVQLTSDFYMSMSNNCRNEKDFVLYLDSGNHGVPFFPIPVSGSILPTKFGAHFKLILTSLSEGVIGPNGRKLVNILSCGLVAAKRIYTYARENGFSNDFPALHKVIVSGTYMSSTWKQRLEAFFQCPVIQSYGLSEFSQGASLQCLDCGNFHFPISIYPEVDPFLNATESEEIGELLLSSLYPFASLQPILRYQTNDVVKKSTKCCRHNDHGFSLLGRKQFTHILDTPQTGPSILSPYSVAEYLESVQWSCYRPDSANFKGIINDTRICNSVFQILPRNSSHYELIIESENLGMANAPCFVSDVICEIVRINQELTGVEINTSQIQCEIVPSCTLGRDYVRY